MIFGFSFALDFIHIHFTYFLDRGVPSNLETTPSSPFWLVDSVIYDKSARLLLEGGKIDSGVPFRPPLYILLLSGIYKMTSNSYLAAKIFGSILSSFSCVMIYLIGAILFSELTGILAGILWASSFGRIMMAGSLNNEALYLFLLSLLIYILLKRDLKLDLKHCVFLGFLSGLAMLTRSEFQLLYVILLFLIFFRVKKVKEFMIKGGVLVSATLFVLSPWMVRNYISISGINEKYGYALRKFVPVTSYGALNFALANNEEADGGFSRNILENKGPRDTSFSFENKQHLYYFKNGYKEGMKFLFENPLSGLKLFGRKLIVFSDALSLGYLTFDFPVGLRGFRRYVDVFYPENRLAFLLNLILLALGFIIFLLERRFHLGFALVFAVIFSTLIATILFFGYVRLGLIILPFLCIFMAHPISLLLSSFSNIVKPTKVQRIVLPFALLMAALVICLFLATKSKTLKTERIEGGRLTRVLYHTSL